MIAIVFIIIFLIALLYYKRNRIESFYPAWNNHVIYNQLSNRLKLGIWKEWFNINRLRFMDKLIEITNIEIKLYDSNKQLLNDLLIEKTIDLAFLTEADFGLFILDQLKEDLDLKDLNKEALIKNKDFIGKKFEASRLFTLYPMYRTLITNHLTISKPDDIPNKVIQISNLSNDMYKLDEQLLTNFNYKQMFREDEQSENRYDNIKALQGKVDGYFSTFNNPDESLSFLSNYANINLIDLYSDNDSGFPSPSQITETFFFLKKDTMNLKYYPRIVQRRQQTFDYYQLPYKGDTLNCYSYRTLFLSRTDVNDERIYQFTKNLYEHIDKLKKVIPYFSLDKKELYQSALEGIVPIHRAVYKS